MENKLILITNPGSSSRKYALYRGQELVCSLHFEFEGKDIICTLKKADGSKKTLKQDFKELTSTVANLNRILTEEGYLGGMTKLDAILVRGAVPGEYFTQDHIVDDEYLKNLEKSKKRAPLHVPVVAGEIEHFTKSFKSTPLLSISDSAFHADRPDLMKYYAFDTDLADKNDIKRFGFHGLSMGSIVNYMKSQDILPEKLIVCHLGSGSSITAVFEGKSLDTTMGYSPLEGLMMATRAGSMDVSAGLAIKRALGYDSDDSIEKYLNKECGLLGVSGQTDDMREIIRLRDEGDKKGTFAHAMFVYRVQSCIGQMAASLGGVDAIVFTATIGERSDEIRRMVGQKLSYLGFSIDEKKNVSDMPERHTNIAAEGSKPVWVIRTDEFEEMIRRAGVLLDKNKDGDVSEGEIEDAAVKNNVKK
ncbi:hypothetical protein IKE07_02040 [Candidatus Saccharibacteria bacterium]|nr:hypothetical protein [Candidatus Saccharibacteria bacterium]